MGLSSSQARLLHLTSRMHQIEHKAAKLQAEKLQMANESDRVYGEYLDALEATKIQYSTLNTDGSVTHLDATYSNLCMGFISDGVMHASPNYLGAYTPQVTGTVTGEGYQLIDSASGRVYVPQYVQDIYNNSADAEEFAENMINYVNGGEIPGGGDTPSGDEPVTEPIALKRGQSVSNVIVQTGFDLILEDEYDGKHSYGIASNGDEPTTVTLSYGINGRLIIEGDNLCIKASDGQEDNIVLLGNDNFIDTRDGDDRIRVGLVQDSEIRKKSSGNTIEAGYGDDYIQMEGKSNEILGNDGDDSILTNIGAYDNNTIKDVENDMTIGKTITEPNDDIDWSLQGNIGNCRTLSLINSLFAREDISDYVYISKDGDDFKVEFKKSDWSTIVKKEDIRSAVQDRGETGDIETIIIERAMNHYMQETLGQTLEDCDYNDMSKVLFGNKEVYAGNVDFDLLYEMFHEYKGGNISNFIVGTGDNGNKKMGIIPHHAYSVTNVDIDTRCIELVNPWDSNDSISLYYDVFKKYFEVAFVFGQDDGPFKGNGTYHNVSSAPSVGLGSNPLNNPHQYYIDLFNMLSESGMVAIPEGMETSTEWLANVVAAGAVLKKLDTETDSWFDTSVATDTHLQEVQDTSLLKQAEAKYEADMNKIDRKERKYDRDLATLDNERNAIKQEMETLKTVAKDNVERTFKLFS